MEMGILSKWDSLLPVVEGNLIGREAGRGQATDEYRRCMGSSRPGSFYLKTNQEVEPKHRHNASEKVVGEAGR